MTEQNDERDDITDVTPDGTPDENPGPGEVPESGYFAKTLRVQIQAPDLTEDAHNRNKDLVLREAINKGLHPKDEVEHVSTDLYRTTRRGVSTFDVSYRVKVIEASEDTAPATTVTPASNPDKPEAKNAKPGQVARDNKKTGAKSK